MCQIYGSWPHKSEDLDVVKVCQLSSDFGTLTILGSMSCRDIHIT